MRNTTNFDTGYDVYFLVVKDLDGFREWYDANRYEKGDKRVATKDGSRFPRLEEYWPALRKLALREFPATDWLKANHEPFLDLFNAGDWATMWFGYSPKDSISGVRRGIIDYRVIPCWSPSQVRVPDAEWVTLIEEYESLEHLQNEILSSEGLPPQIVQILSVDPPIKVVLKRRFRVPYFEDRELPKASD